MKGKKILVVDDEFTIRYLVEHQLAKHGFESIMAKDGPEALEAARAFQPDLIVLDIMMPDMDGFDVCRQLKEDPTLASIPVIFLTALSDKEDKLRAFELGADDYLTKPFQADEFVAHVNAVLRRTAKKKKDTSQSTGRIISLFSPKGGVGTSTLAIQLSETMVLREGLLVVLIDLDLPLGGLAPMLDLYSTRHVVELLTETPKQVAVDGILRYTQRHRANLRIIPAPGQFITMQKAPSPAKLLTILDRLNAAGIYTVLDLGSNLSSLTFAALKQAHTNFIISSGQPIANKHLETFMAASGDMGLDSRRIMPVINELHGEADEAPLSRIPAARIPHASERSRTRLWLQEQGLRKLVSIVLK